MGRCSLPKILRKNSKTENEENKFRIEDRSCTHGSPLVNQPEYKVMGDSMLVENWLRGKGKINDG